MIRQLFKCNHQFVRFYSPRAKNFKNPGIQRRMELFEEEELSGIQDYEDIDNLEADFQNLDKSHTQHEKENIKIKDKIQSKIVEQKYFNEKMPNFLTWAEKEQIKHLHRNNSEEWGLDRLSESFPASQETIRKIVKAKWSPGSQKRVEKHDQKVQENWKLFKQDQITQLPDDLVKHLHKFAVRKFDSKLTAAFMPKVKKAHDFERPQTTEFSSIITSCKGYKEKLNVKLIEGTPNGKVELEVERTSKAPPDSDTYIIGKGKKNLNREVPLSELMKMFPNKGNDQERIPFPPNNPSGTGFAKTENIQNNKSVIFRFKKMEENQLFKAKPKTTQEPDIPEFIQIPKNLYQEGATYKVQDCYYDDDGEFLYRVPGYTENGKS